MNQGQIQPDVDRQKKAIDDNCNTEAAGRVGEPWGKVRGAASTDQGAARSRSLQTGRPDQMSAVEEGVRALIKTMAEGVKKTGTTRILRWPSCVPLSPNTTP